MERSLTFTVVSTFYHLIEFDLLLQVLLHHPVVVIDTVAMEVVHLRCIEDRKNVSNLSLGSLEFIGFFFFIKLL